MSRPRRRSRPELARSARPAPADESAAVVGRCRRSRSVRTAAGSAGHGSWRSRSSWLRCGRPDPVSMSNPASSRPPARWLPPAPRILDGDREALDHHPGPARAATRGGPRERRDVAVAVAPQRRILHRVGARHASAAAPGERGGSLIEACALTRVRDGRPRPHRADGRVRFYPGGDVGALRALARATRAAGQECWCSVLARSERPTPSRASRDRAQPEDARVRPQSSDVPCVIEPFCVTEVRIGHGKRIDLKIRVSGRYEPPAVGENAGLAPTAFGGCRGPPPRPTSARTPL